MVAVEERKRFDVVVVAFVLDFVIAVPPLALIIAVGILLSRCRGEESRGGGGGRAENSTTTTTNAQQNQRHNDDDDDSKSSCFRRRHEDF